MATRGDVEVLQLCRNQGGVISAEQAGLKGLSSRQIQYRVNTEQWIRIRRGVYLNAAFPFAERAKLFALTIGGAGHASHRFAAGLFGLDPLLRSNPEVTTRNGLGLRFEGIHVHESKQLHTADLTFIDGLAVSGIERTIMDCCAVTPERWKILALIDSALAKGLTTPEKLLHCLKLHARRGRDGTVRFRAALEFLDQQRRAAIGPISQKAASAVVSAGLPKPRHEVRIFDLRGNFVAQVDSFWPNGYVHEYDGFTSHRSRRIATRKDIEKRARLRSLGLIVDEFTSEHVFFDTSFLIRTSTENYSKAEQLFGRGPQLWTTG